MTSPSGLLEPFAYGGGFRQVLAPAAPAAGAELTVTVPGDRAWRILTGVFTYTASATVANRNPHLALLDGDGNPLGEFNSGTAQTAGQIVTYTVAAAYTWSGAGTNISIPDLVIYPGFKFGFHSDTMQAGDQISGVRLLVEEFPIGRGGFSVSGVDLSQLTEGS